MKIALSELNSRRRASSARSPAGMCSRTERATCLSSRYDAAVRTVSSMRETAPTFGAMLMPLSLRTTIIRVRRAPMSFIASHAMPAVSAPSPMMATTCSSPPLRSRATAIPCAAEIEVPAWPAPNWSCSDSVRTRKPDMPPN